MIKHALDSQIDLKSTFSFDTKRYNQFNSIDADFVNFINASSGLKIWFESFSFDNRLRALSLPRSYSALRLAEQHEFNLSLFEDAPIVFSMLVAYAHENFLSYKEFNSLVLLKRIDSLLLVLSGRLDQAKQAIKFLSKIKYKKLNFDDIEVIKQVLIGNESSEFLHKDLLTMPFLRCLSEFKFLKKSSWLKSLNDEVLMNQVSYQLTQFLNSISEFGLSPVIKKSIIKISSWDELLDFIRRYKEMYKLMSKYRQATANSNGIKHSNIELIDNVFDLYEQGELQNNCVFDYVDEIVSGSYRIYKVMIIKLSTLGVYVVKGGYLEADQLLTTNNQSVDNDTAETVLEWINVYNQGIAFSNGHSQSNYSISKQYKDQLKEVNQPRYVGPCF